MFAGQPILAAGGFQPALFASRYVGFCRQNRSLTRVNAFAAWPVRYAG
jgi:hypothetical protein